MCCKLGLGTSGSTLLRDDCQLMGIPLIVLACRPRELRLIGSTRSYSVDTIPAKEQHKYRCLKWFLSLSGDADVPEEGQSGAIYDQFVCLFRSNK